MMIVQEYRGVVVGILWSGVEWVGEIILREYWDGKRPYDERCEVVGIMAVIE
jgi:hypothetical protein